MITAAQIAAKIAGLHARIGQLVDRLDSAIADRDATLRAAHALAATHDRENLYNQRSVLRLSIEVQEAQIEQLEERTQFLQHLLERLRVLDIRTTPRPMAVQTRITLDEPPASTSERTEGELALVEQRESETEFLWEIVGLWFLKARKFWTVRRPGEEQEFTVAIKDPKFRENVHAGEVTFREGTVLRARTHSLISTYSDGSKRVVHSILEVLAVLHEPQHEQASLAETTATATKGQP